MSRERPAALLLFLLAAPCLAHDPITTKVTWAQEISRIVQHRCSGCHGAGSPVPLSSYAEARPWAKAIRDQVLTRRMPPWGAVHGVGQFRNDPSLTEPEIERVVQWVEGGAPEGDPIYLPGARAFVKEKTPGMRRVATVAAGHPLVLAHGSSFCGIRPDSPMEATALLPGGRVEHLIWLLDYHALTYVFRESMRLPAGTAISVTSGSAVLFEIAPSRAVAPR